MTPFTLAGAMAPITLAGALAQQNAEALAGITFIQCISPGAPAVYGGFTSNVDMQSGAPAFGTPEYVKTAMAHHEEHLAAWNKVLKGAGKPEVSTPDAKLKPTVDAEFAKVKDFGGAATLARTLEEIAAATYLSAIPTLKSKDAIKLAASIQSIDAKHVAILNYVLGVYPVPDVFAKTDKAAKPA